MSIEVEDVPPDLQDEVEKASKGLNPADCLIDGTEVLDRVLADIIAGKADKLFNCGDAFPGFEIGPGLMALVGAPPGRGKTALAMQALYDAIAKEDGLRAVVASLEVTPKVLVQRRLAMLAGVSFNQIRFNTLTEFQRSELADNCDEFREVLSSVSFLKPDHAGLGDLMNLMRSTEPGLLLVDYIQLFGDLKATAQERGQATMSALMRFCEEGWGVIAISALNRSSYGKADIGSFRDTSSIEYGGTSAYLLEEVQEYEEDQDKPAIRPMKLRNVKNRNGPERHIDLLFNGPQLLFAPPEPVNECAGDFDDHNAGIVDDQPWKVPT